MSPHNRLCENRNACLPIDSYRRAPCLQVGWSLCESCVYGWWEVILTNGQRRIVVRGQTAAQAWYRAAVQA